MGKKLILLIILLCSSVVSAEAQQNIQQKGNNTVAPGLSNIGVLPCIATAAAPTYIEGNQVGCSTDLAGTLRSTSSAGGATYLDADTIVNQTASAVHGQTYMYNGATWDRVRGAIATGLLVNVSNASLAVTGSLGRTWTLASGTDSVSAVQSTSPWVDNVSQFGGNNVVTGVGASGVGIPRVTVSNDSNILATQSGTWNIGTVTTLTGITNTVTVAGNKTNNNAVPGATNVGILPCIANAAAPSYTETFQVGCSEDLAGNIRANVVQMGNVAVSMNTGVRDIGTQRVTIATNDIVPASQSGTWTSRVVGNIGGVLDAVSGAAVPANALLVAGGSVAGGTNLTPLTVKAASTAVAATDTSLVVQPLVNNAVMVTVAAGVQKVGIVGNANAAIDAAHDAAAPANVVMIGGVGLTAGSSPTVTTTGNATRILTSLEGVQYVQEGSAFKFSCFVQAVTVTTQCRAAPAAGLRAYVTSVSLSNQVATVQTLDIVFGTGANCVIGITAITHKWQMGTAAITTSPFEITATFSTPLVPTAANAICVRPSAATAFGATLTGYIAP